MTSDTNEDGDLPELISDFRGSKWERFADISDAPNLGNRFDVTAFSFRRAAEALVSHPDQNLRRHFDLAIAYLCRHHIELSLKAAWDDALSIGFEGGAVPKTHTLGALWDPMRLFFEQIGITSDQDEFVSEFDEIVKYFDAIDERSTTFRYPQQDRLRHVVVDVPKLWAAFEHCHVFFYGLDAMVGQYRDYLSEMRLPGYP